MNNSQIISTSPFGPARAFASVFFVLSLFLLFTCAESVLYAGSPGKILLPEIRAQPGERIRVPLRVKNIDNLAGLKLVLFYDSSLLTFKGIQKASVASSLMHTVNSSPRDRIILVMAGAQGIQIQDKALVYLDFKLAGQGFANHSQLKIVISSVQVMSDKLENRQVDVQAGIINVVYNATVKRPSFEVKRID